MKSLGTCPRSSDLVAEADHHDLNCGFLVEKNTLTMCLSVAMNVFVIIVAKTDYECECLIG